MQLSNDDISLKKENENERNINVNLRNRKFNLLKLKDIYQKEINNMKIKVEQLKSSMKGNEINLLNNNNIDKLKKKIEEVQNNNNELTKKTKEIEKENEQLESFFKNYFEKNNKTIEDYK
jgi:hypothetical protein